MASVDCVGFGAVHVDMFGSGMDCGRGGSSALDGAGSFAYARRDFGSLDRYSDHHVPDVCGNLHHPACCRGEHHVFRQISKGSKTNLNS